MTKGTTFVAALAAAVLTTACGYEHSTTITAPTSLSAGTPNAPAPAPAPAPNTPSLVGTWASNATPTGVPDPNTCRNFQFHITSQTATTIAGSFTGACAGGLAISGNATGTLNGKAVTINVTGGATGVPGIQTCTFTLTANGTVEDNGYTLPLSYSGTTCLGPVHGTETLHRPTPAAPAPPPAPEPPPAPAPPPPPPDPTFGCSTANKQKLVECIHQHVNPSRTVEGGFEVTKRVAWALRGEGAGLLIKNAGENIIWWQGYSFAAGRICYPDGHIFKVLTDVPATNGPSWQDNGFVSPSLYVPAIDPNR